MRILIIRPGAIGDTLVMMPILQQLARYYRIHDEHTRILFVGNKNLFPLLQICHLVDDVFDYDQLQWSRLFLSPNQQRHDAFWNLLQTIDIAICWLRDPEGNVTRNLQAAGIRQIIVAPGRPEAGEKIHIVHYLARTLQPLAALPTPLEQIWTIPPEIQWSGLTTGAFAIHPGSGGRSKCWSTSSFAAIIRELWEREIPVLLITGPAEQQCLADLKSQFPEPSRAMMLQELREQPLHIVAQALQQCRGYLGNDTGVTHLAALQGVPTTALFGPSPLTIWHPIGPAVTVIQEPELQKLLPQRVIKSITNSTFSS